MITIEDRNQLHSFINADKKVYLRDSFCKKMTDILLGRENWHIYKFVKTMRYAQYYSSTRKKSIYHNIMYLYYSRAHNKKCIRYGFMIGAMAFSEGICIYHIGNIVVNTQCTIGKNCKLHGSNCIGNSKREDDCPTIGDNVRLGVGAKVVGDIYIADNITIAAGAVVTKSCYEKGVTLAGIPAKIIKRPNNDSI